MTDIAAGEVKDATQTQLEGMFSEALEWGKKNAIPQTDDVMRIPASNYFDPALYEKEMAQVFRRLPLMLAMSAELPLAGDYKTIEAAGMPILIVRGRDGQVRAFMNSCVHRGANVATAEYGQARFFTCPYHGWTYSHDGAVMGVASADDFGEVDKKCLHLKQLPSLERSGFIWVIANPNSGLSIEAFLSGYDRPLARFGFDKWHFLGKQAIRGPNWKVAYDGYLDFYHLPVLHRNTFGDALGNRAIYNEWGPHQRVSMPVRNYAEVEARGATDDELMAGVWTIFPHISISGVASFEGKRAVMISQLLPGADVSDSVTTQIFLSESKPSDALSERQAKDRMKFLEYVVQDEDYFTGLRLQRSLKAGGIDEVLFGRNEGGAQNFHGWVAKIVAADDQELNRLFSQPAA